MFDFSCSYLFQGTIVAMHSSLKQEYVGQAIPRLVWLSASGKIANSCFAPHQTFGTFHYDLKPIYNNSEAACNANIPSRRDRSDRATQSHSGVSDFVVEYAIGMGVISKVPNRPWPYHPEAI